MAAKNPLHRPRTTTWLLLSLIVAALATVTLGGFVTLGQWGGAAPEEPPTGRQPQPSPAAAGRPGLSSTGSPNGDLRERLNDVTVVGTVRYEDGSPVPDCRISVLQGDSLDTNLDTTAAPGIADRTSDATGTFELECGRRLREQGGRLGLRFQPLHGEPHVESFQCPDDVMRTAGATWTLPAITIPDRALLRLQILLRAPLPDWAADSVITATLHELGRVYFGAIPVVSVETSELIVGKPFLREAVIPRRCPMTVAWSLRSPYGWASVAVIQQVVSLPSYTASEYEPALFECGPDNVVHGRVIDSQGEPFAQIAAELRFDNGSATSVRTLTRTDRNGYFVSATMPTWGGKARAGYGSRRSDWIQFPPKTEEILLQVGRVPLKVRVVDAGNRPITSLVLEPRPFNPRVSGRIAPTHFRHLLRDCADGIASIDRPSISAGERWFVYVPGRGEFAHVFSRDVKTDIEAPYQLRLPAEPTSSDTDFLLPVGKPDDGLLSIRLEEVTSNERPMLYRIQQFLGKDTMLKMEGLQHGIYRFSGKTANTEIRRELVPGQLVIPSDEGIQLSWR